MKHVVWVVACILLGACSEKDYQTSDATRLKPLTFSEKPSQLRSPNEELAKRIESSKPAMKPFNSLHEIVDRTNGPITVTRIDWTPEVTKIGVKITNQGSANFYYTTHYKCFRSGLFFCKSGSNVDYRFKIKGKNVDGEYPLHQVEGYDRQYMKKNDVGETRLVTREKIVVPAGEYTLIFHEVPLDVIRYMSLYEDYCAGANASTWSVCNIHSPLFKEERQEQDDILRFFEANDIASLSREQIVSLHDSYAKYPKVQKHLAGALFTRVATTNSIAALHALNEGFLYNYPDFKDKSVDHIYSLVAHNDLVSAYEWFIQEYSSSEHSLEAVERIHEKMFADAQALDTIDAYNTFVFNYPSAKQVDQALSRAMAIEREIYTDYGPLGFLAGDDDKEKKARKLLIRSKQIERIPQDNSLSNKQRVGYLIVANRMYDLLQQEFDEQDATLRHLESKEFKDFTKTLLKSLENIQSQLASIEKNTRDAARYAEDNVEIARKGFSDASSDRAMSAYYAEQHNQWEKNMHFQKHGYL